MKRISRRPSLLWLFFCPPLALFYLWRGEYGWRLPMKAVLSAAYAALILTILLWPSPDRASGTQVEIVGAKPEAEIFGPELPAGYDASLYRVESDDSAVVAAQTADDTVYVYASASEGSTYYHLSTCKYAYASAKRMTLYEAYMLGYTTPCQLCNPPVYDPNSN